MLPFSAGILGSSQPPEEDLDAHVVRDAQTHCQRTYICKAHRSPHPKLRRAVVGVSFQVLEGAVTDGG